MSSTFSSASIFLLSAATAPTLAVGSTASLAVCRVLLLSLSETFPSKTMWNSKLKPGRS
jgi:hypothetical protein